MFKLNYCVIKVTGIVLKKESAVFKMYSVGYKLYGVVLESVVIIQSVGMLMSIQPAYISYVECLSCIYSAINRLPIIFL